MKTLTYREDGYCRVVDLVCCPDSDSAAFQAAEFSEICDRLAWDEDARVVLLYYDGGITAPAVDGTGEPFSQVEAAASLKQSVIAAVRGNVTGFGLELALACDIRIACEDACFGFPQVLEGKMLCHGGTQRLPRLIGQARAMHMLLACGLIDAAKAVRWGLVHRTVSSATLATAAMDLAAEIADKSPLSLAFAKEAVYGGRDLTLDQGLRMELDLYLLLFSTSDRVEGIRAFREKRKPEFLGE